MSPTPDLEALYQSPSRRRRRFISLSSDAATSSHVRHIALLIIAGSFILLFYLYHRVPLSLTTSSIIFLPTQYDHNNTVLEEPYPPPVSILYPPNSTNLYLLFTPNALPRADTSIRTITAHNAISDECIEEWVGTGRWTGECSGSRVEEPRVDFVWTWVNGSDPLHRAARNAHPLTSSRVQATAEMKEKQYREHDELRFSLRSAKAATKGWKNTTFHVVANSYSIPSPPSDTNKITRRLGQIPQWLNLSKISEDDFNVVVHHDADLFRLLPSSPNDEISDTEMAAWLDASLPTFNSLAVESQLANLPPSEVSENTVFLMDDNYVLRPLPTSTFYSPIHGPIFHLQADLLVNPASPGRTIPWGWTEWRGLVTAASHLSERFGTRGRPYLVHNARSIPLPLLHEASLAFPSAFSSTAVSRFRGQNDSMPETHTLWLATHFIIERHREALLWSWVVGKWGGPKATITAEDKEKMWLELGADGEEFEKKVKWPKRKSRLTTKNELESAGLPDSGPTNYAFVSSDGYPYTYLPMARHYPRPPDQNGWADLASSAFGENAPLACTINREECLNHDTIELANGMFKRIMLDKPHCGDCIISALTASSGSTGFSAFLPPKTSLQSPLNFTSHLPLTLTSLLTFPYPSTNPRLFALRLIQRYSYVLGGTPSVFFGVTGAFSAQRLLDSVDADKSIALLCVNDDLLSTQPKIVASMDDVLKNWMNHRWPHPLSIEST